jgi:hypothetical protein
MLRCTCMIDVAGQKESTQESGPVTSGRDRRIDEEHARGS